MKEAFNIGPEIKPEIPNYKGRIYYFGEERTAIHLDESRWEFETNNGVRDIPILSIWNPKNHQRIAEDIIMGKRIAMYMWGTFGTGYLINFPEWQSKEVDETKDLREKLKIGRPKDQSFPTLIYPDDEWMFWDFDNLHENLQHLRNAQSRYDLRESGPVHLIVPRKKFNSYLDESLQWPHDNTFCNYYMPHPGWEEVIKLLRKQAKHSVFAGGSLNMHKRSPVYTTKNLHERIKEIPEWSETVDLIVICEISEAAQVFRSQTQIRLAQKGSDGVSEVVRRGSMLPERWSQEQGIPIKDAPEGVGEASSAWSFTDESNIQVDEKVQASMIQMKEFDKVGKKEVLKIF